MRFSEFRPLLEDDFDDLGDYVEDGANHEADNALINILRGLQFSAGSMKMPKVAVGALINLVKNEPGGEAFDLAALENAKANNETVKAMIKNIEDNDEGVKYVFLNPSEPIDGAEGDGDSDGMGGEEGGAPAQSAPEKTVSQMANRALGSRS